MAKNKSSDKLPPGLGPSKIVPRRQPRQKPPEPQATTKPLKFKSLKEAEKAISGNLLEIGEALTVIRDNRFYREDGFTEFDDYCRNRWGLSEAQITRKIQAGELVKQLPIGQRSAVTSERQARELSPLKDEPEKMTQVMEEVIAEGKPTAKKIREKVNKLKPRKTRGGYQGGEATVTPMRPRGAGANVNPPPSTSHGLIKCPECGSEFEL